MKINLYEEMNEKIADIIAIGGTNADLYASAYIKALREENKAFKDKLESGQLVELPFPRQPYVYHIIKRTDRTGKPQWYKRQITWETLVAGIALKGNDGLYFKTHWEAEARLKELQEK